MGRCSMALGITLAGWIHTQEAMPVQQDNHFRGAYQVDEDEVLP